jgi:Carboxylesterase family
MHRLVLRMPLRIGWCSKGRILGTFFLSAFNVLFQIIQHPYASFNGSQTFTQMTPTEDAFAAELIAYWLSFVRSGDPNQFRLSRSPEWPMYKNTSRIVLQQGPGSTTTVSGSFIEAEPETDKTRCALVGSQVEQQQNWSSFFLLSAEQWALNEL